LAICALLLSSGIPGHLTFDGTSTAAAPLSLIAGFPAISTAKTYYFGDLLDGVTYMSSFINSRHDRSFDADVKRFWKPLADRTTAQSVFGHYPPFVDVGALTDVNIIKAISRFYCIATYGTEVRREMKDNKEQRVFAAYSEDRHRLTEVWTVGDPPDLASAWIENTKSGTTDPSINSIEARCDKLYFVRKGEEYLTYNCACSCDRSLKPPPPSTPHTPLRKQEARLWHRPRAGLAGLLGFLAGSGASLAVVFLRPR
jgi:hypothetical protein